MCLHALAELLSEGSEHPSPILLLLLSSGTAESSGVWGEGELGELKQLPEGSDSRRASKMWGTA